MSMKCEKMFKILEYIYRKKYNFIEKLRFRENVNHLCKIKKSYDETTKNFDKIEKIMNYRKF